MADTYRIREKLEAGRAALETSLRALADRIEAMPLEDAAEAMVWLQATLTRLAREAEQAFRRG